MLKNILRGFKMDVSKKLLTLFLSLLIPAFIALRVKTITINIWALIFVGFILPWFFYFIIKSLKKTKN